jgi:uncharacterized ferritin-like protein (DUF455 family)
VLAEPPHDTVERWAWSYILADTLAAKLEPPPVPEAWEEQPPVRRLDKPGRPPELRVVAKAGKTRGLAAPSGRARALHTFFHHELQAAELMAWAVLAFPDTPREFRGGLVRIALDEIRHMHMYSRQITRLGYAIGAFTVRDWFWERVPRCVDATSFVATMGLGVESANLEHTASFAARFREAGDEEGARVQELVGREEIGHVRFGARWFETFTRASAGFDFESWRRALPPPLSPMLMRGRPLHREARRSAGQSEAFLDELDAWQPDTPGS